MYEKVESVGREIPTQPTCRMFYDEDLLNQWNKHSKELEEDHTTNVFESHGSTLCEDSGFSDVKRLYSPSKCLTALLLVSVVIGNLFVLARQDLRQLLSEDTHKDQRFLLTPSLLSIILGEKRVLHLTYLIPACELFGVVMLIGLMLKQILVGCVFSVCFRDKPWARLLRWFNIALLWCSTIPYASSYSAMKLLYYVTPSVIYNDAFQLSVHFLEDVNQGATFHAIWSLTWFALSRFLFLIVGFDAFIVKFRMVELYVNDTQISYAVILNCMMFTVQVLNIVNLRTFTMSRLFLFIFAGEDGKLQKGEEMAQFVWISLLTKQAFKQLGCLKATIALLAFNDYTFQTLVLEEAQTEESKEKTARRKTFRRKNFSYCSTQ